MCGIVGIVSNHSNGFSHKETALFAQLLFLDTVRGFDSTGVFGVHNNRNVVVHKDAVHGLDFLRTKEFSEFKTEMIATGKVMVGHNRAATRGTIVDKNAHPFVVDDKIVLVQNGTYKGSHRHLKDTDVDTEAIAHVISENDDVTEALKKINASYALVWYNADKSELNIIRNSERPMHIAKMGSGFVFASEASMIQYAAGREEIKIEEPIELPAHTHVVITLDGKGGCTRVDTKLDIGTSFQAQEVEDWYSNYRPQQHHRQAVAYSDNTPTVRQHVFGKADIKETFADFAHELLKYTFDTSEAAVADMDAVNAAGFQGHHYVEMLDYFPANRHKDCTAWHVFGTIIGDNSTDGPATLVHWIVYEKTEHEIMDYVTGQFYKVKLGSIVMRRVQAGGAIQYMNTSYATYHEEIQGVPQQ